MKLKSGSFFNQLLKVVGAVSLASLGLSLLAEPNKAESDKFICGELNGKPITYMVTSTRNVPLVIHVTNSFGSEWSAEKLGQDAAGRFQAAYEADEHELTVGKKNGINIICSATHVGGECKRQIMPLPEGLDPTEAIDIMLENTMTPISRMPFVDVPRIKTEVISYTDGWNGELRPYLNLQQIRRYWDWDEQQINENDLSEINYDLFE